MKLAHIEANLDIFLHKSGLPSTKNKNVSTTMIYTLVLNKGGYGVGNPVDGL
jgi:hypothetical protein